MFSLVVLKAQSVEDFTVLTLMPSVMLVSSLLYLFWTSMGYHLLSALSLKMCIVAFGVNFLRSVILSFMSVVEEEACVGSGVGFGFLASRYPMLM